ncbi:uncharacterized protein ACIBXB_007374 isoform 1-T1 [Morphnus guianensis]
MTLSALDAAGTFSGSYHTAVAVTNKQILVSPLQGAQQHPSAKGQPTFGFTVQWQFADSTTAFVGQCFVDRRGKETLETTWLLWEEVPSRRDAWKATSPHPQRGKLSPGGGCMGASMGVPGSGEGHSWKTHPRRESSAAGGPPAPRGTLMGAPAKGVALRVGGCSGVVCVPGRDAHGHPFPGAGGMHVGIPTPRDMQGNWGRGNLGTLPQGGGLSLPREVQCGRGQAVLGAGAGALQVGCCRALAVLLPWLCRSPP